MSIPREVGLRQTAEGIRLVQKPAAEMKSLRDLHYQFNGGDLAAANDWLAKNQIQGNRLEFEIELAPQASGVEGIKLLKGAQEETVVGVDRDRGTVFVDRTHSGNVGFNQKFAGAYPASLLNRNGKVKLHIFVDACSVEVFVNDGQKVFTVLSYPSAASRGVEFFGTDGEAKVSGADAWGLKTIWK
jgi:sucrose-6-phosphate hydrolase SacC (GH32 family)